MPPANLDELLIRRFYPERTLHESLVIREWLLARGDAYDRLEFGVRVGRGQPPNPEHLPAVQWNTSYSTRKRIDILAWQGQQATIVEVKLRVTPAVLGQLETYRQLFLEERPDALEPKLVAVGQLSDEDTLRVLQAHGVTVLLYERPAEAT